MRRLLTISNSCSRSRRVHRRQTRRQGSHFRTACGCGWTWVPRSDASGAVAGRGEMMTCCWIRIPREATTIYMSLLLKQYLETDTYWPRSQVTRHWDNTQGSLALLITPRATNGPYQGHTHTHTLVAADGVSRERFNLWTTSAVRLRAK